MNTKVPYRISDRSITALLDNRPVVIPSSHPNFQKVKSLLSSGLYSVAYLRDLMDIPKAILKASRGRVSVYEGEVQVDGKKSNNLLATRILQSLENNLPIYPMMKFLDNLSSNPNEEVREDLWAWLESGDMPVTEDGCFIAYKYVQEDYYSRYHGYQGKVYHGVGQIVEMPRRQCDESRYHTCSSGLHFCGFDYLKVGYANNDRVVIVKVNPSDVVAIPTDYNNQKGRTCRYEVVGEVPTESLTDHYRGKGVAYTDDYINLGEPQDEEDFWGDDWEYREDLYGYDMYDVEYEEEEEEKSTEHYPFFRRNF